MQKYDIKEPFVLPVGMHHLHNNASYSFQLNRLVNMDLGDLEEARRIGSQIHDNASWKSVLLTAADREYAKGNLKSAMGFYRMAGFFMRYDDPDNNASWQKARELFFQYYEDFFTGEHPIVEQFEVPYEGYTLPTMKMNPDGASKGVIVTHGGFDSSYEEFFPQMMYLRQLGYTVYLFEGPGQGACLRLHNAPLIIEWEKPVKAVTSYFDLKDVTLVGESLGGFYAPRASAFDERVTRCVSIAQFPSLKQNFTNHGFTSALIVGLLDIILYGFGWLINIIYHLKKGKGMDFFNTYYKRIGSTNAYTLARFLWRVDLRPIADKLTKDYLIIGGSKDTMASRASIGKQMYLLKNAKSITAREITEKEQGADHCNCGNQQVAMDMIDLWIQSLKRRDETLSRVSSPSAS